jgi:CRP-like cAMP-binding protein
MTPVSGFGKSACLDDPLWYLPRRSLREIRKDEIIYGPLLSEAGLYLVLSGRVKISRTVDEHCVTVSRIIGPESFFGESTLIGSTDLTETAAALESVTVMAWRSHEVYSYMEKEPRLGVALLQSVVRECLTLQERIVAMAVHKTPERVMLAFIQLAAELGAEPSYGWVKVASLTHQTIADYVGTSREIVTFQMNRLRRMGLIRYSRKDIDINVPALKESLQAVTTSSPIL